MFNNIYHNKRVLITGHTGFKGSWLTAWLLKLGAEVCGVSDTIPTNPSLFEALRLQNKIRHNVCDVRDQLGLEKIIHAFQPDFIFHLAAQAIVSESYKDPIKTFQTNIIGTANVLDCLRTLNHKCVAIFITSDKCYENKEWAWGYRENDRLGGKDVYSASKASAELMIDCYKQSFFPSADNQPILIASARAGNVIGGGDWSQDRIVVDCIRSWVENKSVQLRSPYATRPWQHVLEPLSGYLTLGMALKKDHQLHGESFNFGPRSEQNHTVLELIVDLGRLWGFKDKSYFSINEDSPPFHEAGLLKLNCDKALIHLNWLPNYPYMKTIEAVGEWYNHYYKKDRDMFDFTRAQINEYETSAVDKGLGWTI